MRRRNAFLYLGVNVSSALIGFAMLLLVTRILTPFEYGIFTIFQSVAAASGVFVGLNAQALIFRKLFDNKVEDEYSLKNYVTAAIVITLLSCFFSFLLLVFCWFSLDGELKLCNALLAVLLSLFLYLIGIRTVLYQGNEQPIPFAFYQVGTVILIFLGVYVFLVLYDTGVQGRIYAAVLGPLFFAVLAMFSLCKKELVISPFRVPKAVFKDVVSFGVPMLPHSIFGMAFLYIDRWVIASNIGYNEVGVYGVALQIVAPVVLLFDAFDKTYIPWLYEKLSGVQNGKSFSLLSHQALSLMVILAGASVTFLMLLFFIGWVLPETYNAPKDVLCLLFFSVVLLGYYQMPNNVLLYFKETKLISLATGVGFIFYLFFLYLFTKDYGLTGVAGAFFLSVLIRLFIVIVVSNYIFQKEVKG